MEKNISLAQREQYAPSQFTEFLWWLSTAEKELLADAVVDRNRYRIVGMTVLATWALPLLPGPTFSAPLPATAGWPGRLVSLWALLF